MGYPIQAQEVYEQFKDHFDKKNFHYETIDDKLVIKLTVHGEDLPQPTIVHVDEDRGVVQILSPIPARMPEEKRTEAAIAVAAANYGLVTGSFDLDLSDGEIRYRATHAFRDGEMTEDMVEYMLKVVFFTTDKYNDKFFALAQNMMTLEQFLEFENNQ